MTTRIDNSVSQEFSGTLNRLLLQCCAKHNAEMYRGDRENEYDIVGDNIQALTEEYENVKDKLFLEIENASKRISQAHQLFRKKNVYPKPYFIK